MKVVCVASNLKPNCSVSEILTQTGYDSDWLPDWEDQLCTRGYALRSRHADTQMASCRLDVIVPPATSKRTVLPLGIRTCMLLLMLDTTSWSVAGAPMRFSLVCFTWAGFADLQPLVSRRRRAAWVRSIASAACVIQLWFCSREGLSEKHCMY